MNSCCLQGGDGWLSVFAAPYTGNAIATIATPAEPTGIAFCPNGDLAVASVGTAGNWSVGVLLPPHFTSGTTAATPQGPPSGLACDSNNDLFVANGPYANGAATSGNNVLEYAAPYTGKPIANIANGVDGPQGLALNANGALFVANSGNSTITEYASPYTGAPITTISDGVSEPYGVAFDAKGDLFVSNTQANTVTEYAAPFTGAPMVTVTSGVDGPAGIAVDSNGVLFVANGGNDTVTEYASPYTGAPIATIANNDQQANNVKAPGGVAFGLYTPF